jgi:hydroxypyruvate isomerase
MPRFSANVSTLFTELPFLDRFAAAREAGFEAVEFQFPYDFTPQEIAARVKDAGLMVVLFNLPPGDFAAGERGLACHPRREKEFAAGVSEALRYAAMLDCRTINCLAGLLPIMTSEAEGRMALKTNLSVAAGIMAKNGIQLVIEAINSFDMPRFFLNRSADAEVLMDELQPLDVKFQYDVYHMQRMEGELFNTVRRLLPRIGHIQIADVPGRHEPGTGEINFPNLFRHLDAIGYGGWVGCEYVPRTSTGKSLAWLRTWMGG